MPAVKVFKGSSIDIALQRLRKAVDREGTLKKLKEKRFYEKPSRKKYRHQRRVRYNQRIRSIEEHDW